MSEKAPKCVVVSASSDIGEALCRRWLSRGWEQVGTFRTRSQAVEELSGRGAKLVPLDLLDDVSRKRGCEELRLLGDGWDVLVLCPGTLAPVGLFCECDFGEWEMSCRVNFMGQLHIVHELLPKRNRFSRLGACVIFFAGGGTNSAPVRSSAYTVSKIALIKMTELLDAEVPDARFAIIGPGWVGTKIHKETLDAGTRAGSGCRQTRQKLAGNDLTPMDRVLDCCDWVIESPRDVVSGRNFAVAHDSWGEECLALRLRKDPQLYKLRRHGNDARRGTQG